MATVIARIHALEPTRTWARPGGRIPVTVRIRADGSARGWVELELRGIRTLEGVWRHRVRLTAGEDTVRARIALPASPRRGYALRARLVMADAPGPWHTVPVEAIDGWWEAPRHIAFTEFAHTSDAARHVAGALHWHATVAQAYDWMYRHYQYETPEEPFTDPLGRRVSHTAVKALVREGHRAGLATLAYGSVYGAEPEYVTAHPDERVFDEAGQPLSLGGAFFINDLRPGSPWRARLLAEYARACRRFGFDGIHMDTYGPPHEAFAVDGERLEFAELYPGLVAEGAARVAATGAGRRVLFNCVEGFPIDAVAGSPTAAHYLELWPPDDRYVDVVRWIDRARSAGPGKAVVIAAYVPALRAAGAVPAARAAAVETAVLLTSIVSAAGGFHHVLAQDDRVLVEGYYPEAVRLRAHETRDLRAAWLFGARYLHILSAPERLVMTADALVISEAEGTPVPLTSEPQAGAVWIRATQTPAGPVVSLVDLRAQSDDRWTSPRQPTGPARGWTVHWPGSTAPVAMSPWSRGGEPVDLSRRAAGRASWRLPTFRRWIVLHDPSG